MKSMIFLKAQIICLLYLTRFYGQEIPGFSGNHSESPQIYFSFTGESVTACSAVGFCFIQGSLCYRANLSRGFK